MKLLLIHADKFSYEVKEKALKEIEEIKEYDKSFSARQLLVVFCSIEKNDGENIDQLIVNAASTIESQANTLKVNNIVIYPYAHLSSDLASPSVAISVLNSLESKISGLGYKVKLAPFGWYKSFEISCKGHPLSELSRNITAEVITPPTREKNVYKILTQEMELYDPLDYHYKKGEEEFKLLVEKEALSKEVSTGVKPKFLDYCKKFGIAWESFSDVGHMRYGPEANLLFELVSEYSGLIIDSLGLPIYRIRGTNMFDLSNPAVNEHAKLFGGRLYEVNTDSRRLVLRYAACHQQFAMLKDWIISYKDLPFGAYELADSYRFEQEGELLLCFRLRKLHMPDLHILCKNIMETELHFLKVHQKIYDEIGKIGRTYVSLYNTTKEYFENHKDFFKKLLEVEKKPVLLCFVPQKFYWILNIEYNIIDELGRVREIGTCQIDVGNSKRFNITYIDEKGDRKYPTIIHTAIIGTIERYLYTLFDSAAKSKLEGKLPMLPVWLSPTQVRIIPVTQKQLDYAFNVLGKLERMNIRVDIDDSDETLPKKVRKAETGWVPYIIVIGENEIKTGEFDVRYRYLNQRRKVTLRELVDEVKNKIKHYPWKPLPVPKRLSMRPVY